MSHVNQTFTYYLHHLLSTPSTIYTIPFPAIPVTVMLYPHLALNKKVLLISMHETSKMVEELFLKSTPLTKEGLYCKQKTQTQMCIYNKQTKNLQPNIEKMWPETNPARPPEKYYGFLYIQKSHFCLFNSMAVTRSTLFELCSLSLFHCSGVLEESTFSDGIHFACLAKEEMSCSPHSDGKQ